MFDENNVVCAEILLAKYFTEHDASEWHPVNAVLGSVNVKGVSRAEIKEARKRLEIDSKSFGGGYRWKWSKEETPESTWKTKSKEFFRG